jgi:hypothetical protein
MNAYSLYFLLPTDIKDPPKTMDIPIPDADGGALLKTKSVSLNKRKMPSSVAPLSDMSKAKKPKAAPFAQLQAELDTLSIEILLERMNEAMDSERWERKHQLIGSTISLHAVKDATAAAEIREQAVDGGVPRTEIMRWIKESPKYSTWVNQMMSKMEAKSYQNTITKALLKAGNVRTGSGGRYIKWILPGVTLIQKDDSLEKADGEEIRGTANEGDEEEEEEDGKSNMDEEDEEVEDEDAEEGKGGDDEDEGLDDQDAGEEGEDAEGAQEGERNNYNEFDEDATNENEDDEPTQRREGFETFEGEHESDDGEGHEAPDGG